MFQLMKVAISCEKTDYYPWKEDFGINTKEDNQIEINYKKLFETKWNEEIWPHCRKNVKKGWWAIFSQMGKYDD